MLASGVFGFVNVVMTVSLTPHWSTSFSRTGRFVGALGDRSSKHAARGSNALGDRSSKHAAQGSNALGDRPLKHVEQSRRSGDTRGQVFDAYRARRSARGQVFEASAQGTGARGRSSKRSGRSSKHAAQRDSNGCRAAAPIYPLFSIPRRFFCVFPRSPRIAGDAEVASARIWRGNRASSIPARDIT